MRKFALLCAVLGLSIGFSACDSDDDSKGAIGDKCSANADCESGNCEAGVCKAKSEDACKDKKDGDSCSTDGSKTCQLDNDALVCKDKPAEETDPCKDKKDGDSCGDGMICNSDKECVADLSECASDADCKTAFPKCDTEAKKCYKVNDAYTPICSNEEGKKIAYSGEWLYADDSQSKILSKECTGDTPDCKDGTCVAESQVVECTLDSDCTSKAPKTKCDVATNTCVEPAATTDECDESGSKNCETGKTCVAGKCLAEAAEKAACDATFVERCTADMKALLACDESKVVKNGCVNGYTCQYDSNGTAECVENCPINQYSANDIQHSDCDAKTNTAYNYICEQDYYKSGYLFAFERTEACGTDKICKANDDPKSGEKAVCDAK